VLLAAAGCADSRGHTAPVTAGDPPRERRESPEVRLLRRIDFNYGRRGPRAGFGSFLGRSGQGRPIRVTVFGSWAARPKVLVVGCIHGDECAGRRVLKRVMYGCPPVDADVWLLDNLNPDGLSGHTRLNGRGVDLNRNFPAGWRPIGRPGDPEHSGQRPLSEPETRLAADLIGALRPGTTIWFHQHTGPAFVRAWGRSVPAARRYARAAGVPFRRMPWMAGTAPNWQNHRFPGTSAFVVELPSGPLTDEVATRHAAAVERLAGYTGENRLASR
jgi:protein MpaA